MKNITTNRGLIFVAVAALSTTMVPVQAAPIESNLGLAELDPAHEKDLAATAPNVPLIAADGYIVDFELHTAMGGGGYASRDALA